MINCTDFIAALADYVDGEIAEDIRAQIEAHLAHCQTCQVMLDSTRKTFTIVTDCGSFDLRETDIKPLAAQVMARIRAAHPKS